MPVISLGGRDVIALVYGTVLVGIDLLLAVLVDEDSVPVYIYLGAVFVMYMYAVKAYMYFVARGGIALSVIIGFFRAAFGCIRCICIGCPRFGLSAYL